MLYDIIIIGAGSVGLSFALSTLPLGLKILLVESVDEQTLLDPPYDGREISLSQRSLHILRNFGIDLHAHLAPIASACVTNRFSPSILNFHKTGTPLGGIISHNILKKILFQQFEKLRAQRETPCDLITTAQIQKINNAPPLPSITLTDDRCFHASLIIAADSRFSTIRKMVGIGCDVLDFGRTCFLIKIKHNLLHNHIARECFHDYFTLAVLPLEEHTSSLVITVDNPKADFLRSMTDTEFERYFEPYLPHLGSIERIGSIYEYPLFASYAHSFFHYKTVLLGDAAVGMHPVTAQGLNIGLFGQNCLANMIREALNNRSDFASSSLLTKFSLTYRSFSWPLYKGTNAIVQLYTSRYRRLRSLILALSNRLPIGKAIIIRILTHVPSED